ncbi:hypothetical protein NM208_g13217 [Fusarium decemcellulare]|uniref:Uncharacterized protein n=1 Tax=Fusarium decemcellulare TaxID=57161 RepID=A0ACC1RMK3_9HYPO|nr:hypothetical protein NM208_g13217 [Fusarium decemcellulare]
MNPTGFSVDPRQSAADLEVYEKALEEASEALVKTTQELAEAHRTLGRMVAEGHQGLQYLWVVGSGASDSLRAGGFPPSDKITDRRDLSAVLQSLALNTRLVAEASDAAGQHNTLSVFPPPSPLAGVPSIVVEDKTVT